MTFALGALDMSERGSVMGSLERLLSVAPVVAKSFLQSQNNIQLWSNETILLSLCGLQSFCIRTRLGFNIQSRLGGEERNGKVDIRRERETFS